MKKAIAIALAMLMLAACGNVKAEETGKAVNEEIKTESPAVEIESEPENETSPEEKKIVSEGEEPVADAKTAAEDEPEEETGISSGRLDGQTYINDYFNISCTLGDEWTYASEEELASIFGTAADMMDEEEYKNLIENGTSVTEMYAMANEGLFTINANVGYIGLAGSIVDESTYIDAAMSGEQNIVSGLEQMGVENIETEKVNVTIAGRDACAARVYGEYYEVPMYEMVIAIKEGSYLMCLTVCTWNEDACEEILEYFVPVV